MRCMSYLRCHVLILVVVWSRVDLIVSMEDVGLLVASSCGAHDAYYVCFKEA